MSTRISSIVLCICVNGKWYLLVLIQDLLVLYVTGGSHLRIRYFEIRKRLVVLIRVVSKQCKMRSAVQFGCSILYSTADLIPRILA